MTVKNIGGAVPPTAAPQSRIACIQMGQHSTAQGLVIDEAGDQVTIDAGGQLVTGVTVPSIRSS